MTKKEMFAEIKNLLAENEEIVAFCEHEIELLSRKKSSGNSKAKAEAEARAEKVYEALAKMENPVTVTEFIALTDDEDVAGYTNQRVSALLRKLGDKVTKEVVKGKSYFSVA